MSSVNDISTIKRNIRLSDIVGQTLSIKKQPNDEYLGKCPFHNDSTPSLRVYDHSGKYYCFGCNENGDVFDWLEKQRGMTLQEAREYLGGERVNVPIVENKRDGKLTPLMPVPSGTAECYFPYRTQPDLIHYYHNEDGELMFLVGSFGE